MMLSNHLPYLPQYKNNQSLKKAKTNFGSAMGAVPFRGSHNHTITQPVHRSKT